MLSAVLGRPREHLGGPVSMFDRFWVTCGGPSESLLGPRSLQISQVWSVSVDFSLFVLVPLKRSEKATNSHPKRSLFGGGRHGANVVNSSKKLVFRVFEEPPFL